MRNSKILEALNKKILLYQEKRNGNLNDKEDLIVQTYISAYIEVEDMIKTGKSKDFLNSEYYI